MCGKPLVMTRHEGGLQITTSKGTSYLLTTGISEVKPTAPKRPQSPPQQSNKADKVLFA